MRVLQRDDMEGRSKPIWTGYRTSWHFGERNSDGLLVMHDAPLELEGADTIEPGAHSDPERKRAAAAALAKLG